MIKIEDCKVGTKVKIVPIRYGPNSDVSRLLSDVESYITKKFNENTVEISSGDFGSIHLFDIENLVKVEDNPIKKDNNMTYSIGMIFESNDNDLYVLQKYSNNIFLACLDGRWFSRGIYHSGDIYNISQEAFNEISKSSCTTFKLKYLNFSDMLAGKEYVKPVIKRKVVYETTTGSEYKSEEEFNKYNKHLKFIRFVD